MTLIANEFNYKAGGVAPKGNAGFVIINDENPLFYWPELQHMCRSPPLSPRESHQI